MIDGFIDQAVLKTKARLGAGEDVLALLAIAGVLLVIAVVFLSIALYTWLATLYGGAIAALDVGLLHVALVAIVMAGCAALRRRHRERARQRLALAAKSNPWPLDPAVLAVGLEIGKVIGWRKLLPLAAAGVGIVAALSAGRNRHDTSDTAQQQDS